MERLNETPLKQRERKVTFKEEVIEIGPESESGKSVLRYNTSHKENLTSDFSSTDAENDEKD